MDKRIFGLFFLILFFFILNYSFLDSALVSFLDENENIFIDRVIDGDTIVSNGTSIRLLGINCPEKGEKYSIEATQFLENLVLNKSVQAKITGKDKYYRKLAYVFVNEKNINLELVENGFANFYFPSGKGEYYEEFFVSWKKCLDNGKNLCGISEDKCGNCIGLVKWDVKEQTAVLKNNCSLGCDLSGWSIKDEGRKKFIFSRFVLGSNKEVKIIVGDGKDSEDKLFWSGEEYVWTRSGDSLFLRDKNSGLVIFENY